MTFDTQRQSQRLVKCCKERLEATGVGLVLDIGVGTIGRVPGKQLLRGVLAETITLYKSGKHKPKRQPGLPPIIRRAGTLLKPSCGTLVAAWYCWLCSGAASFNHSWADVSISQVLKERKNNPIYNRQAFAASILRLLHQVYKKMLNYMNKCVYLSNMVPFEIGM